MGILDLGSARKVKDAAQITTPARLVGVLAGGSLGQRAVAVLGLGLIAFAIFKSLGWVAVAIVGWVLCYFSIHDYERTQKEADDA